MYILRGYPQLCTINFTNLSLICKVKNIDNFVNK